MAAETSIVEGWAIVELMGHRRLAGRVSEVESGGSGFIRLDVPGFTYTEPEGEQVALGQATQFYSPAAVYCITPTTEQVARQVAESVRPTVVSRWELEPPRKPAEEEIPF